MENQAERKWYKKWWIIALACIIGLVIIFSFSSSESRQGFKKGFEQGSQK